MIGTKGLNFLGFNGGGGGVTLGDIITKLGENGLFAKSSQMIGPKWLKFSGFDGSHPGVVIRKFGEDRSKTLPVGLFPPPPPPPPHTHTQISWLWSQLYE